MEHIINQIHKLLIKKRKTVAIAESCTGGLISDFLSRLSGSSQYFLLGIVAYSNRAKETILKIPPRLLAKNGAVSQEVALRLARQVRKTAKADIGIGVTGIAGPSGGTPHKPVGTVFIALDSANKKFCRRFLFKGTRIAIRKKAALKSLALLKLLVTSY